MICFFKLNTHSLISLRFAIDGGYKCSVTNLKASLLAAPTIACWGRGGNTERADVGLDAESSSHPASLITPTVVLRTYRPTAASLDVGAPDMSHITFCFYCHFCHPRINNLSRHLCCLPVQPTATLLGVSSAAATLVLFCPDLSSAPARPKIVLVE